MAYDRVNWIDDETPLNAQNMNNIEDGIEEALAETQIDPAVKTLAASMGWQAPE